MLRAGQMARRAGDVYAKKQIPTKYGESGCREDHFKPTLANQAGCRQIYIFGRFVECFADVAVSAGHSNSGSLARQFSDDTFPMVAHVVSVVI